MDNVLAEKCMHECISAARAAAKEHNYPLAAMVVRGDEVLSIVSSNLVHSNDPTAHPEIQAIRTACEKMGSRYIHGAVLVTTLEPCPMCTAAAIWAKFDGIVFGASQEDAVKWSQDNPQAKFSWRQILTKCKSIADTGEPRLWVRENVLQTECNALFGLIDN